MDEISRYSLQILHAQHPYKAIVFENDFLGGEDKKPFGFVPNNWNGERIVLKYKDKK